MIVEPTLGMPTRGARVSANTSLRMYCSITLRSEPPYSFGHEGAIQPLLISA